VRSFTLQLVYDTREADYDWIHNFRLLAEVEGVGTMYAAGECPWYAKDKLYGTWNEQQLALIYTRVGEPEKALDRLEPILRLPSFLSSGWLKIDPAFDPLRSNPRFEKLVNAKRGTY